MFSLFKILRYFLFISKYILFVCYYLIGSSYYLNVTPKSIETHPMRDGLIVSNDLYGKCMDKKEQGVKVPCYWFVIDKQAFFWPSKEMACEGRTIIVGDLFGQLVLSD